MDFANSLVAAVLLVHASASVAITRPIENWTYKKLWADSQVVCIAHIVSSKLTANPDFEPDHLERIESTLKISLVMKGDAKLTDFVVVHYRYKKDADGIGNGPSFMFGDDEIRLSKEQERGGDFMLFLKRSPEGLYKPTSGDLDAGFSVQVIKGQPRIFEKVTQP